MRTMKYMAAIGGVGLMLSLGAVAKNVNSGKFVLGQTAKIGSTVLPPGHYMAEWNGSKDAMTVSIVKNGKTVATTHGALKELPSKAQYSSVTTKTLPDKSSRVDEIDFGNRTEALVFSGM